MPYCTLSIIIVSWNVKALLADCLRSIEQASMPMAGDPVWREFGVPAGAVPDLLPGQLEVIVVDNGSADGTPEAVSAEFPWVRLIRSAENLGFTGGNNRGYAESRGEFLYFLNPDTVLEHAASRNRLVAHAPQDAALFTSSCSLTPLLVALQRDERVGMAGPQLRRFPEPLTGFFESTWLGQLWPGNPWARRLHMAERSPDVAGPVDWLVGAAMLCRRSALEAARVQGGLPPGAAFDDRFFMYSEEVDLGRRLAAAGWRVTYAPDSVVTHYEGKSSEQVSARRQILFNRSKVLYWRKWFGAGWAETLRRYLLLEFRLQLWLEQAKWLAGHKRALRAERIAAYRQVLASRLVA
jgi:GT2 family glycosyltransferase